MGSTTPCIFCGAVGPKMTKEDVLPRWLGPALGLRSRVQMVSDRRGPLFRPTKAPNVRLGNVCLNCNGGWLSALETGVKNCMVPALSGSGVVDLTAEQCRAVATWATKEALLLELSLTFLERGGYNPPGHLRWLSDHREPPPRTQVWLGAVDAQHLQFAWSATSRWGASRDAPKGYMGVFAIGYVLFQVFGRDLPGGDDDPTVGPMEQPPAFRDFLLPLWPGAVGFHWPPRRGFSWTDLDRIWPPADR